MPIPRTHAAVASLVLLLSLPACVYDGRYLVQGRLRSASPTAPAPLPSARIVTRGGSEGTAQPAVLAEEHGTYRTSYWYSGIEILFFTQGDGDPWIEFTAPGHRPRAVRLRDTAAAPGVVRR